MFYLRHEEYDPKYSRFHIFKHHPTLGIQQYCKYEKLTEVLHEASDLKEYDHYFLLDDGRFHFFRFDIYREFDHPFSIDDFNEILQERITYLKGITKEELLFTNIDAIYIDGKPQKYLLGAQGKIYFRLCLIYINRNTLIDFNKYYGDFFSHKKVHIFPESFKTISFLKRHLERENFLLLYIKDTSCKVIDIQDGFYKKIEHINLGVSFLMQMYKENEIVKYWYKSTQEIDAHPLAKNLVVESVSFYVEYLSKWLGDLGLTNKDIFIISPIIKNGYFMELFNKKYSSLQGKYIVPFHSSSYLQDFGRQRDPSDMDLLIFLNGKPLKQQLLVEDKK